MKNRTITILISGLLTISMISEAQVEVLSSGNTKIGADNYDPGVKDFTVMDVSYTTQTAYDAFTGMRMDRVNNFLELNRRDHSYKNEIIWYSGYTDIWNMGMNDSDNTPGSNVNSFFIGKELGGTNPFIWLDYTHQNIGLFTRNPNPAYDLTLNGDAIATGYWSHSDLNLKQNISAIESSLQKLMSISGITYEFRSEFLDSKEVGDGSNLAEPKVDSAGLVQNMISDTITNKLSKTKYGVIAQEVLEQFPDLVHRGADGYYSVNYDGLIPVLIEAIKDQQAIIENIQNELHLLKESNLKSLTSNDNKDFFSMPVLYQNNPNPFTQNTSIKYKVPDSFTNGCINIYDLNGKQIRSITLAKSGESSILVSGGELNSGMYLYSLIVDGQIIDTKQMVLTD